MFLFHLIRMVKNQTFKINPDPIIMNNLLKIFGLSGLTDSRFFTKENMKELSTVEKIKSMEKELSEYYLPCKAKKYLVDLTEKKCITILRQFLKYYHYKCIGIEKSKNGKKNMTYRLIYHNKDQLSPTKTEESRKYILSFEM